MGLLSDYNTKFANRLELLRTGMEDALARAHRELESFNEDFIGIYNELHRTLHEEGGVAARPKDDPDAEAKARVEQTTPSGLPMIDLTEFELAIIGPEATL